MPPGVKSKKHPEGRIGKIAPGVGGTLLDGNVGAGCGIYRFVAVGEVHGALQNNEVFVRILANVHRRAVPMLRGEIKHGIGAICLLRRYAD